MKNVKLYNAAMVLIEASKYVSLIDKDFASQLLDKAQLYSKGIVIDKTLEGEVIDFAEKIKKGL